MLEAVFSEILTDFSCLSVVKQIIKFIIYRKQQIPFCYDKMTVAVREKLDVGNRGRSSLDPSERLFRQAEQVIICMEEIFEQLGKELEKSSNSTVKEIAMLLGGSLLTPKQVYRIEIPLVEHGHLRKHHSDGAIIAEMLRLIVSSDELDIMLNKPLQPTNMFLLIRKINDDSKTWLLPKPRYKIPSAGQHFSFKLDSKVQDSEMCSCKGFQIYADSSIDTSIAQQTPTKLKDTEYSHIWYQAPVVMKGFKDMFVHGISVSNSWARDTKVREST